ncbi:MAG: dihydropteroate synthase [Flavobacteriales bacterium TMED191]|nr:MAG: dihydropteroate synthase [Flavobacteriales bacterium TMED191]|tara:strand:+ start:2134 stop:2979 length:846 start_codon:yes stop_codon:yes gene_type:complete
MPKASFYTNLIHKKNKPLIMGILNLTPDSFYDGGKYIDIQKSIKHIKKMVHEGVNIIDIGAVSSRPGANEISVEQERKRLIPVLKKIKEKFPQIYLSIDTYRYQIAEEAIEIGIDLINNINTKKEEDRMLKIIKKTNTPYVLMHIKGEPSIMQNNIQYDNFHNEIIYYFKNYIKKLNQYGISNIILDPGFGFGKTMEQNYLLINMIPKLKQFGYPVLTGISRKSMISKLLNIMTKDTLNGTSCLNTIALMKGTDIIRVHDIKEAKEIIEIYNKVKQNETIK